MSYYTLRRVRTPQAGRDRLLSISRDPRRCATGEHITARAMASHAEEQRVADSADVEEVLNDSAHFPGLGSAGRRRPQYSQPGVEQVLANPQLSLCRRLTFEGFPLSRTEPDASVVAASTSNPCPSRITHCQQAR